MQHAFRVYLQIKYWKALSNTEIDLQLWLWKNKNEFFEPVMTYDPQNKLFPQGANSLSVESYFVHPK